MERFSFGRMFTSGWSGFVVTSKSHLNQVAGDTQLHRELLSV